jgi:hypothetical protein
MELDRIRHVCLTLRMPCLTGSDDANTISAHRAMKPESRLCMATKSAAHHDDA